MDDLNMTLAFISKFYFENSTCEKLISRFLNTRKEFWIFRENNILITLLKKKPRK